MVFQFGRQQFILPPWEAQPIHVLNFLYIYKLSKNHNIWKNAVLTIITFNGFLVVLYVLNVILSLLSVS